MPQLPKAVTEGLLLGNFEGDKYRTDKRNGPLESAALVGFASGVDVGLERGENHRRKSQNFARDLGNEPSKFTGHPSCWPRAPRLWPREAGLAIDILDEKRIEELKMGALLSVARGSAEFRHGFMVLTYTPANLIPGAPVLGLVGKAITFDTGGISIKPANDMGRR